MRKCVKCDGKRSKAIVALFFALIVVGRIHANGHSEAAFKKMPSLAGEWVGQDKHGMEAKSDFKVMVSNTTLMETLAASGMEEMVTFYHVHGDAITLVHFCPTNNQPRMRAIPKTSDVSELNFVFEGAGNLPSRAGGRQHR